MDWARATPRACPTSEQCHAAEQHRTRAKPIDDESRGELHDAARHVEHADDEAEQRPRDVEFRAQQRKQRRQRELQKVRNAVREAYDTDDAGIPAERLRRVRYPMRESV